MEYRNLGNSGVKISQLVLGCMNFGIWTPEKEGIKIIHAAIDGGIICMDTSNSYGRGKSEEILGKAIKGKRDKLFICSKVWGRMGDGPNERGLSRYHIMEQIENSLSRLKIDALDLYQLHRPDPSTPIEETLETLDLLIKQGKIRYWGTSGHKGWEIAELSLTAQAMGIPAQISEQSSYSIVERELETDVYAACQRFGVGIISYSPICKGFLSGKYKPGEGIPEDSRFGKIGRMYDMHKRLYDKAMKMLPALQKIAAGKGISMSGLAVAWILHQPYITAPIIGPRTMAHLKDNLKALEVSFSQDELNRIDEISSL